MDDPGLSRQLRAIEEPAVADPDFLDALFERLLEEAGFRRAEDRRQPAPGVRQSVSGRAAALDRRRRWVPLVLVAALLIGGGLAIAAGVGGLIPRGGADRVPNICELVTPAQISAIVGAPVTLEKTDDYGSSAPALAGRSCAYSYPPGGGTLIVRSLGISIARPADPSADWGQLQRGVGGVPVEGLGDAARLFPVAVGSVVRTLYVLKGPYLLSVFYSVGGGQSLTPQQMEDIARLLLARL